MKIDQRAVESVHENRRKDPHESGRYDEIRLESGDVVAQGLAPRIPRSVIVRADGTLRHAPLLRRSKGEAFSICYDSDHSPGHVVPLACLDQRFHVRATAGNKHHDVACHGAQP